MSDPVNPYQGPETSPFSEAPSVPQGSITENMLVYLRAASPWIRFIAVVGFVFTGFAVFGGIASITFIPLFGQLWSSIPGMDDAFSSIFVRIYSGVMGVAAIASSAIIFFPSLFAYRFGDRIRKYMQSGSDSDLEEALKNNKSLWKFAGILTIIYLAFIPVLIIISVIVGVAVAAAAW